MNRCLGIALVVSRGGGALVAPSIYWPHLGSKEKSHTLIPRLLYSARCFVLAAREFDMYVFPPSHLPPLSPITSHIYQRTVFIRYLSARRLYYINLGDVTFSMDFFIRFFFFFSLCDSLPALFFPLYLSTVVCCFPLDLLGLYRESISEHITRCIFFLMLPYNLRDWLFR